MPTRYRDDEAPVVEFDPRIEISPFAVFRRLREGPAPLVVDVRRRPAGRTLRGALAFPGDDWTPPADRDVVLFDDSGAEAPPLAARLQAAGFSRVRALFGGLELYEFALSADVVGKETFLDPLPPAG